MLQDPPPGVCVWPADEHNLSRLEARKPFPVPPSASHRFLMALTCGRSSLCFALAPYMSLRICTLISLQCAYHSVSTSLFNSFDDCSALGRLSNYVTVIEGGSKMVIVSDSECTDRGAAFIGVRPTYHAQRFRDRMELYILKAFLSSRSRSLTG